MRRLALCATAAAVASGIQLFTLASPAQAPAGPREVAKAAAPQKAARRATLARSSSFLLDDIARYREQTWRWQRLMSKTPTHSSDTARTSRNAGSVTRSCCSVG